MTRPKPICDPGCHPVCIDTNNPEFWTGHAPTCPYFASGAPGRAYKPPKLTPRQRAWKRMVVEMGRKGGIASAKALTPGQRKARARNAVAARWSKLPSPR